LSDSLKTAIQAIAHNLTNDAGQADSKRADSIVNALALIRQRMGLDFAESLLECQLSAVPSDKRFISFVNVLGLALYRQVHYELAISCFMFRIGLNRKDKVAFNNLGLCYNRIGKSKEAAEAYQGGLDADPHYKQAGSNLLYLQHYIWDADPDRISRQHKDYAEMHYHSADNAMSGRTVDLNPLKKLKLGFLSGDLRFHAVSRFIAGIFAHLDRKDFELFAYHTYTGPEDGITEQLKSNSIVWKRVHKMDTDALAAQIKNDDIDILLDLSVYTQGGVPDLIARQVAPIQINYMGYPDTSGIQAMNYRIADDVSDPPETEYLYSEKLIRLPVSMWNYTPWPDIPQPMPPPCINNGYITFGSMNNHAKIQREWLEVWARVLLAVPGSKLLLKSRAMGSERINKEVLDLFEAQGVAKQRIIAKGFETRPNDHFLSFNEIDICLDTLPYNGTTTTFDSLWMGVPVVTMTGDLHVSRTSASILTGMGLADWIATDSEEFINICKIQSGNLSSLAELRGSLRNRMRQTTLGDPVAFCQHFAELLRELWKTYCKSPPHNVLPLAASATQPEKATDKVELTRQGSDQPLITIVVCASNQQQLDISRNHLTTTVGTPWEFIGIDNASAGYSLAEAYNIAGDLAKAPVIAFIHDDVFIATPSWGKVLRDKFDDDQSLGLIGLAGTAYLQTRHPYWVASKAPFIHGQVIHHNNDIKLSRYSDAEGDQQVVAIDGLMMVSSKQAFLKHHFDAKTFDGFHFYDLDFSVRVSEQYKVVTTTDILVKHLSGGSFDESWKRYRQRFREKFGKQTFWSCIDEEPQSDSHLQRLNCHFQLSDFYNPQQIEEFERLGITHPKHPQFDPDRDQET